MGFGIDTKLICRLSYASSIVFIARKTYFGLNFGSFFGGSIWGIDRSGTKIWCAVFYCKTACIVFALIKVTLIEMGLAHIDGELMIISF